jgi:hypothetical protein
VIARLALDHVGQPEDGAAAVLLLCSEQANYITGVVLRWTADFSSTTRGRPDRIAATSRSPRNSLASQRRTSTQKSSG